MVKWYLAQDGVESDTPPEKIFKPLLWAYAGDGSEDLADRLASVLSRIERKKALLGFFRFVGPTVSLILNLGEAWTIQRTTQRVITSS